MKNAHIVDLVPTGFLLFISLLVITACNLLNVLSGSFPAKVIAFLKIPGLMILGIYYGSYLLSIVSAIIAGKLVSQMARRRQLDIQVTWEIVQYALMLIPAAMTANKGFYWYVGQGDNRNMGIFFFIAAIIFYIVVLLGTCWNLFRKIRLANNKKRKAN